MWCEGCLVWREGCLVWREGCVVCEGCLVWCEGCLVWCEGWCVLKAVWCQRLVNCLKHQGSSTGARMQQSLKACNSLLCVCMHTNGMQIYAYLHFVGFRGLESVSAITVSLFLHLIPLHLLWLFHAIKSRVYTGRAPRLQHGKILNPGNSSLAKCRKITRVSVCVHHTAAS